MRTQRAAESTFRRAGETAYEEGAFARLAIACTPARRAGRRLAGPPPFRRKARTAIRVPGTPELIRQIQFVQTIGIDPDRSTATPRLDQPRGPSVRDAQRAADGRHHQWRADTGGVCRGISAAAAKMGMARRAGARWAHACRACSLLGCRAVPPPPPAPDRFASCQFDPQDFAVGGKQYTPQSYLDEGFGGSTTAPSATSSSARKRATSPKRSAVRRCSRFSARRASWPISSAGKRSSRAGSRLERPPRRECAPRARYSSARWSERIRT